MKHKLALAIFNHLCDHTATIPTERQRERFVLRLIVMIARAIDQNPPTSIWNTPCTSEQYLSWCAIKLVEILEWEPERNQYE